MLSVWQIFGRNMKKNVSQNWSTRTDSLPCNLTVFISKLSECKQVELSAAFLFFLLTVLVSMNDTFQLDLQFYFIFIITTS